GTPLFIPGACRAVGAAAPGAKVFWLGFLLGPRAVLPPLSRGSPTPKPGSSRTVGAPAAGAKVLWLDSLFAPRAVLLHLNRGSPTSKPGFSCIKTGVLLEP